MEKDTRLTTADKEYNNAVRQYHTGQLHLAEQGFRRVLDIMPDHDRALYSLGTIAYRKGDYPSAADFIIKAINANPNVAEYYNTAGVILGTLSKDGNGKIYLFRKAVELSPGYAEAHYNLGCAMRESGKFDEAVLHFREAVKSRPDYAEAHYNLGIALEEAGNIGEAILSYRKALQVRPDYARACNNLARALNYQGKKEEALAFYRKTVEMDKGASGIYHSNYLMSLHYSDRYDREALYKEALCWGDKYSSWAALLREFSNSPDPDRKIRIGYVSADFYAHPAGYFIHPVLAGHDRERFEVYCYDNGSKDDKTAKQLRSLPVTWRSIAGMSDEAADTMIAADGIDILIDLSGHSEKNRLQVFSRKPAPVQATWIGYFDTTGLKAMDYIIADRHIIPEGDEKYYVEKVIRLPGSYLCYMPHEDAPAVAEPPFLSKDYITFGCFNNIAKITPEVVEVWSRVLQSVPASKLSLRTFGFNTPSVRDMYVKMFARHGISPGRIDISGNTSHGGYLAMYNNIDIVLETFPFTGNTTTMDALWMGVPVPTLVCDGYVGRLGLSIQSALGLNMTAYSKDEYVAMTAALAQDTERLAYLRSILRDMLATSPLCDQKQFITGLEKAYRDMWWNWCMERRQKSGSNT